MELNQSKNITQKIKTFNPKTKCIKYIKNDSIATEFNEFLVFWCQKMRKILNNKKYLVHWPKNIYKKKYVQYVLRENYTKILLSPEECGLFGCFFFF